MHLISFMAIGLDKLLKFSELTLIVSFVGDLLSIMNIHLCIFFWDLIIFIKLQVILIV